LIRGPDDAGAALSGGRSNSDTHIARMQQRDSLDLHDQSLLLKILVMSERYETVTLGVKRK